MKFRVKSTLQYKVTDNSTFVFNISVLQSPTQSIIEETFSIVPAQKTEEFLLKDGSPKSVRIVSEENKSLTINYSALVDKKYELINKQNLTTVKTSDIPLSILPYLLPSRYCQSDKLIRLAQDKFGNIKNAYDSVRAICSWIHKNVDYVSGSTGSETSAFDTVTQREGVCRDFAHLGIALCRALTIPARYVSCYAYNLTPPDFHACFEAYLGGRWIVFDATHLAPLNGLVKIGIGRDATDVAVATIYGNVSFLSMEVSNQVQEEGFTPLFFEDLEEEGLTF